MSEVLDYLQEKDPKFREVPHDELVRYVGERYPEFLKDEEFKGEFDDLTGSASRQPVVPKPWEMEVGKAAESRRLRENAEGTLSLMNDLPPGSELRRTTEEAAATMPIEQKRRDIEERNAQADILARMMRDGLETIDDPLRRKAFEEEMQGRIRATGVEPIPSEPGLLEAATTPLVKVPRVTGSQLQENVGIPKGAAGIVAGLEQGIAGIAEFFTTPLGLATMGTAKLPPATQQVIAGSFAADMARRSPDLFAQFGNALGRGDYENATRLAIEAGANVWLAGKTGEAAVKGEPRMVREAQGRTAGGGMLDAVNRTTLRGGESERVRPIGELPQAAQPEEFYQAEDTTSPEFYKRGENGGEMPKAPRADALDPSVLKETPQNLNAEAPVKEEFNDDATGQPEAAVKESLTAQPAANVEGPVRESVSPQDQAPAGYASVGEYRDYAGGEPVEIRSAAKAKAAPPQPVLLGGMEHVRPMEMPEIVRMATELSGSVPDVGRLPKARGLFDPATGQIKLNREVFKDPEQAAKTLAHEVGHLADYLPDRAMDRGNILGRLAALRNFLTTTFPKSPADGAPLTPTDRAQLRREAEAEVGPKPSNPGERDKWSAEVSARYSALVDRQIHTRGLAKANEVWREAYELSKWWRPFDDETASPGLRKYRKSSAEVYADAISVLLNAPRELKTRAPKFWDMFFNYLDRKPEVKRAYADLQDLLTRGPGAVRESRLAQSRADFQTGEEILRQKLLEREERRKSTFNYWIRRAMTEWVDHGQELTRRVDELRAAGVNVPQWKDPRNAWEVNLFFENRNHLDIFRVGREVVKPVEDAGMDTTTLGQVLELQRIIGTEQDAPAAEGKERPTAGTRVGMANPQGLAVQTARDTLGHLYASLGPAKAAVLEAATKRFRALVVKRAGEAWRAGIFSDEMWQNVIVPNSDSYVAFRPLEYIETFVTPMARQAKGTLKAIENPFVTTMYKLAAMNNLIAVQRAKIATRDFMREYFPRDWKDAATVWDGKRHVATRRVAEGMKRLEMIEGGKVTGYDVEPFTAAAFEKLTPANVSVLTVLLGKPFRSVIYPLIVKFNPSFQLFANPIRDFTRTARNIGAVTGMSRWQLVRNYVKSWQDAKDFVNGRLDNKLVEAMLESSAMGTPMDSFNALDREDAFGELLKRYKLAAPADQGKIMKALMRVPRAIEYAGSIFEALPKIASYKALVKERGMDAGEAAAIVRNYAGTPNFRVKGLHGNVANVVVPFVNMFLQGYRTDFHVATNPRTAGGFWMRWALNEGKWSILTGLAAAGVLGPALKSMFGGVSEYDKSNYSIIPVGYEAGGDFGAKVMYVRLPRDESSRVLSAAVYKATRILAGDKSARTFPTEIFAMGAGAVPTPNSLLQIGGAWMDYLRGLDPIDPWRGRPVVPETEFKAGGWNSMKPMMQFTLDKAGVINFFGWDPRAETATEILLSALPIAKRAVKISDYGMREQAMDAMKETERLNAIQHLDYSAQVRSLLSEYYALRALENKTPEQEKRYSGLSFWHMMYSKTDEASGMIDAAGNKSAAREMRKSFSKTSEAFEREGKHSWAKVGPIWKMPPVAEPVATRINPTELLRNQAR